MKLTARQCQTLGQGYHADGSGLYLQVTKTGARSWIYRYSFGVTPSGSKRRVEMGLGSLAALSLADARKHRAKWAAILADGKDPKGIRDAEARRAALPGRTVAELVAATFETRKHTLRDGGAAGRWLSPLNTHILPALGSRDIETIDQNDLEATLRPIWRSKPDAARKAMQRLKLVMEYAAARGLNVDLNAPLLAKALLGDQGHMVTHIPAMRWAEVPTFYQSLTNDTPTTLALRLLILTATRSRPIRFAHADQFDLGAKTWTIPGEGDGARQKGRLNKVGDFAVPLSDEAIIVIERALQGGRGGFLFPGQRRGVISDMAMVKVLKDRGLQYRPHGFRSSFRDWCSDAGGVPEHIAEKCLSHVTENQVARAYHRTDSFLERQNVMNAWAAHVSGGVVQGGNVVSLRG